MPDPSERNTSPGARSRVQLHLTNVKQTLLQLEPGERMHALREVNRQLTILHDTTVDQLVKAVARAAANLRSEEP